MYNPTELLQTPLPSYGRSIRHVLSQEHVFNQAFVWAVGMRLVVEWPFLCATNLK